MTESETARTTAGLLAGNRAPKTSHLLVFAYYFPPQNESGSQRPFRFVKHLARRGYLAHVVTRDSDGGPSPWQHVIPTYNHDARHGWPGLACASIRWLERILPYRDQLPWMPHAVAAARRVLAQYPVSAIFSTSPPPGAHVAAWRIKRQFRIPWIADFRDPIWGNPFRSETWGGAYDSLLERLIVSQADIVITNTDSSAELLRRRYPRLAQKIHLIWNGFDPEEVIGPEPIPARGYKVLLHAGSIYGGRHPGALLASLKRLNRSGLIAPGQLRVRLVGPIEAGLPWLTGVNLPALIADGWVECTDRQIPQQEARCEMAQSDYLLLLDLNELGAGLQVPAKLFEYIRIGRPILAFTAGGSPVERILSGAGVPHVCVHEGCSPAEVDAKVADFLSLPSASTSPSPWFHQCFDATVQVEMLCALLRSLQR
jgi:glycosyltransferase involved in cell wall biosynthesis